MPEASPSGVSNAMVWADIRLCRLEQGVKDEQWTCETWGNADTSSSGGMSVAGSKDARLEFSKQYDLVAISLVSSLSTSIPLLNLFPAALYLETLGVDSITWDCSLLFGPLHSSHCLGK